VALARTRLAAAASRLDELSRALSQTGRLRLRAASASVTVLVRRLTGAAPRLIERGRGAPEACGRRIVAAARGRVRVAGARVDGMGRLAHGFAPERTLDRGFSITRNAAGRALRSPAEAAPGEVVKSRLAGGILTSRVEAEER
jgi:exodeoxyribonuclease VII large subunit